MWYEDHDTLERYMRARGASVHVYSYTPLDMPPAWKLLKHKKTPVIPLVTKTADDILAAFRDTTRNEVRRTFALDGLTFDIGEATAETYAFYQQATRSQGRIPQKRGLFRGALVASARYQGKIIAAIAYMPAQPIAKVLTISSLRRETDDAHMRAMIGFATKRLVYEVCVWGIAHGYEGCDLAYINLDDPSKKGITDFKMGFGGEVRDEWQYVYVSPMLKTLRKLLLWL